MSLPPVVPLESGVFGDSTERNDLLNASHAKLSAVVAIGVFAKSVREEVLLRAPISPQVIQAFFHLQGDSLSEVVSPNLCGRNAKHFIEELDESLALARISEAPIYVLHGIDGLSFEIAEVVDDRRGKQRSECLLENQFGPPRQRHLFDHLIKQVVIFRESLVVTHISNPIWIEPDKYDALVGTTSSTQRLKILRRAPWDPLEHHYVKSFQVDAMGNNARGEYCERLSTI